MVYSIAMSAEIVRAEALYEIRERHAAEERVLVLACCEGYRWRRSVIAEALGISPNGLLKTLAKHGLLDEYRKRSPGRGRARRDRMPRRGETP